MYVGCLPDLHPDLPQSYAVSTSILHAHVARALLPELFCPFPHDLVIPPPSFLPSSPRKPPPRWFVEVLSSSLFWYLEKTIGRSLVWLYPTNQAKAGGWLADEIYRWGSWRGLVCWGRGV